MSEDCDSIGESNNTLKRIKQWRDQFDRDMDAIRYALTQLAAPRVPEPMSVEDCVFLWALGIKVENDILRESWTI